MKSPFDEEVSETFQHWKSTCSVPNHPDKCPSCGTKVRIFHLNLEGDAIFACKVVIIIFVKNVRLPVILKFESFSELLLANGFVEDKRLPWFQ